LFIVIGIALGEKQLSRKAKTRYDRAMRLGICKVCKRLGYDMWYKPQCTILEGLDKSKFWAQLVCNHFIGGQSKDRNDFCYIPNTVREAKPEEVVLTYRVIGKEPPVHYPNPVYSSTCIQLTSLTKGGKNIARIRSP
jgi:hypothetical protein